MPSPVTQEKVLGALKRVIDPDLHRDIVSLGMVKNLRIEGDVYGPNMPLMMGVDERPRQQDQKLVPLVRHGVIIMSMGFLLDPDQPVIWRGPMLHGVMKNFVGDVLWGELDYLLVDLPPG